jgi:hypothetical protein
MRVRRRVTIPTAGQRNLVPRTPLKALQGGPHLRSKVAIGASGAPHQTGRVDPVCRLIIDVDVEVHAAAIELDRVFADESTCLWIVVSGAVVLTDPRVAYFHFLIFSPTYRSSGAT